MLVSREDFNSFSSTRYRDIPLFLIRRGIDRGVRKKDKIGSFALSGVGCDRVTANELTVVRVQRSPVLQLYPSIRLNVFDRYNFPIGDLLAVRGFPVRL